MLSKSFDLLLRGLTLGGRFVLVFSIAKFLTSEDVGVYGIIGSVISYILYFLGMDFYTYSTRDIINNKKKSSIWNKLYNQFVFFAFNYIIFIFIGHFIFSLVNLSNLYLIGIALAIVEHLSQEIYRVLIALKEIKKANFQYFLRCGMWCYFSSILLILNNNTSLNDILLYWLISSLFSFLLGVYFIYKIKKPVFQDFFIDFLWIIKGIKISSLFLVGTIFLRGIFFFDKILLQTFITLKEVGVYIFFFGVSSAIQSFVDVLIISRYFPKFIQDVSIAINSNHKSDAQNLLRNFFIKIFFSVFILSLLSLPLCFLLCLLIGKAEYTDGFVIYISLVITNAFLLLSMPFHYLIYSVGKDGLLVRINIISFFIFVSVSCFFIYIIPSISVYTVIFGMGTAYLFILFSKIIECKKIVG